MPVKKAWIMQAWSQVLRAQGRSRLSGLPALQSKTSRILESHASIKNRKCFNFHHKRPQGWH